MFDLRTTQAKIAFFGTLLVLALFLFFPIYWLIATSFKGDAELYRIIPTAYPQQPVLDNYRRVLTESNLPLYLKNSAITAISATFLNTLLAIYAGYSFSKYRYRGRKPTMLFMLSAQMFPFGVLLISLYPMLNFFGLLDTRLGLTISYIVFALPVSTYMLYSYFSQIPNDLIHAARADGASELRILHTIIIPISIPAVVTVLLYGFMWAWNDLLYSMTLITASDKRTIGPGLLLSFLNETNSDWGGALSASLMAALPVVTVFAFLQKYFIQGVTAGAVKS